MFHLYVSYFLYCSNCFMLSPLSLTPNACATGMEGNTFPLGRRTVLRLTLEDPINSLHSSERWLIFNDLNKPSTSLHATRVPSRVKNSFRFLAVTIKKLFSRVHPNISVVSIWMQAVRPLYLAATVRILDYLVRFV
jgi:hypothetical protein